jgi:hypothetical protein
MDETGMDLGVIRREAVGWIHQAQDGDQRQAH